MRRKAATTTASDSQNERSPHPYVVAKSEIHDFVRSLSIQDLGTVAARFHRVAELLGGAFKDGRDHLEQAHLTLIKRIANEGTGKRYRRIMAAIIAGVRQGREGISSAHLTANLVVQLTFRWSPEYRIALDCYRHRLSHLDHKSTRSASRGAVALPQQEIVSPLAAREGTPRG